MSVPIPVNLAVEDEISEAILRRMLQQTSKPFAVGQCFSRGGSGYLRRTISGFNNAARGCPFFVMTDLDSALCPPELVASWLQRPRHPNLLFRVAVKEAEAWVLADRQAIAAFLGVRRVLIPEDVDGIFDPKQFLINLARSSAYSTIRRDLVPPAGSLRRVGPLYNARIAQFVEQRWEVARARHASTSCQRAMGRIEAFEPTWSS